MSAPNRYYQFCVLGCTNKHRSHICCLPNCLSEKASWHSVRLILLKLPVSIAEDTIVFMMLPSHVTRMILDR